jgi:CRISPR-associated protein Csb2
MPTVARYSLDSPVLPSVSHTLPLAEAVRRCLMSRYRKVREFEEYGRNVPHDAARFRSSVFSGKDALGAPLQGQHRHAFYLPTDDDGDGRIDHVIVHAPGGIPQDEVRSIDAFRRLKHGDLDLSLLLVGLGGESEFRHTRVMSESRIWVSATPFLVTRHLKRRGRKRDPVECFDSSAGQTAFVKRVLQEELARNSDFHAKVEIEHLDHTSGTPALRPLQFRLGRMKTGDDGKSRPRGLFRLRFPNPVKGPIALGHSCHFGLGLFVAEDEVCSAFA